MVSQGDSAPAWQTDDLVDEWIEEEETEDEEAGEGELFEPLHQPPTQTNRSAFNARGSCNFGTTSIAVPNTSHESEQTAQIGTFVIHSDLPATNLPQTPALRKKKGGVKDIFSPLQLERMFEPPSPPKSSPAPTSTPRQRLASPSRHRSTSRPVRPSKLSQVIGASTLAEESELGQGAAHQDEIRETDTLNVGGFGEAKPSSTCRFTFSVPRSIPRFPARVDFGTPGAVSPVPNDSDYKLQTQMTPFPTSRSQRHTDMQPNPNDSRLRLFQFQYDTFTREHLSAIVDSFGVSSPSNVSSSKHSVAAVLHNSPEERRGELDDHETFSQTRAAKRLKLTPPSELTPDGTQQEVQPVERPAAKRDYVGESKSFMQQIKRARDFSMMSTADALDQDPGRRPLAMTDCTNTHAQLQEVRPDRMTALASSSTSAAKANNAFGSKFSSMAYRKQAAELMAKIKRNSGKGDNSLISQKSEDDIPHGQECSWAPSPEIRPKSPIKRRLEDKENQSGLDPDPDPPSYAASVALNRRQFDDEFNMKTQSHLPAANQNARRVVVMPVAIPDVVSPIAADRIRSPNPTFLAPPPTAFGSMRFSAQMRTASTNEDLNRLVSSGSTATTVTVGSASSGVKHAGPAQMVRIAPADLPPLPERVGGMVFDRTLGRWVKERGSSDRTIARSSTQRIAQGSPTGTEGFTESEDPFRDIESLRDGESGHSPSAQGAAGTIPGVADYHQDGTDGTEEMHVVSSDSDSDFDDEEDAQLSTFTFDRPPTGIIQIMTSEEDDTSESDEGNATSNSDDDDENGDHEIEGGEEDFYDNVASMSIHEDQLQPDEGASIVLARADAESRHADNGLLNLGHQPPVVATPCKVPKRSVQPPRSALKSASVTPISRIGAGRGRSVSFSDGRKDGKILGLHSGREREEAASRAARMPAPDSLQSVPSVRSKRIMKMLEGLEESLLEDDDQSFGQRFVQAGTLPSVSTDMQRNADLSVASPRSFVRSQTIRRPGQSSPRRVNTPSRANATFLTECSFGVAHDRLVEVITDVQPFEPYWDTLSSMNLYGQKLDSVARLKEFLPKLDSLNLNNNLLSWLSGIPRSVRTLSVASNALTRLTSFGHLSNLENLDISYNDIDSLQQLECLRHLRELRADGNKVSNLDGLELFDGLVKLSVEGNQLQEIDLTGFRWSRLELLNLSNNRLENVRGLHAAPALISINLDNNLLPALDEPEYSLKQDQGPVANVAILQKLRILRLSGNRLKRLDVTRFPNLRTLYVDNNYLAEGKTGQRGQAQKMVRQRLISLHRLCKLENFSARNQSAPGVRDSGLQLQSSDVRDVKRLYLSGNPSPIPFGVDAQACYNLVYLELAACRLTSLPANFSSLVPNVRALNLNYNFLETDEIVRALTGLQRLRKLTIVGNRMTGTKALVRMLSSMGKNVEMLDFRMNPSTLAWYLPLLVQDRDNGALLQPSEPPRGKHHSPFASVLPPTSRNPAEDFEGVHEREIGTAPSSSTHTEGTRTRPINGGLSSSTKSKERHSPSHWEALDAQFRRGLPNKAYVGRLAYRGLIMRACPQIKVLDGVRTTEKERRKAEALLRRVLKEAEAKGTITRIVGQR